MSEDTNCDILFGFQLPMESFWPQRRNKSQFCMMSRVSTKWSPSLNTLAWSTAAWGPTTGADSFCV